MTLAVAAIFLQPLATHARSGGAPTDACINLTPNHNMIGAANDAPGGYFIYTSLRDIDFNYNASTEYTSRLTNFLCCKFNDFDVSSYSLRHGDVSRVCDPST